MTRHHLIAFSLFALGLNGYAQLSYKVVENWGTLPPGRAWGSASGVSLDHKGNIWIFERCGVKTCDGRTESPLLEFDKSGRLVNSFGSGMFIFPHGLFVDRDNNVWVTDADGKNGKGHQVFKFSPDGKVLMTLGKAGITGTGPDTFNRPSDAIVAPNGDVFVADGHGGDSNARIVKFTKDGKFIKTWGKKGPAPGEFDAPHALAFDSKGRLFVADRGNHRIQIFDQDGKFLDQWKQFGWPTGIFIDEHDTLYVVDNTADGGEFKRGMHIGSAKDGSVKLFIPDPDQDPTHLGKGAEAVAADSHGNLFAVEVSRQMVKKYVKE
jgi:sugar lactone lactonase YvrE